MVGARLQLNDEFGGSHSNEFSSFVVAAVCNRLASCVETKNEPLRREAR